MKIGASKAVAIATTTLSLILTSFVVIPNISDVRAQQANTTNSGGSTFANSSMNATGGNNITLGNLVDLGMDE